MSPTSVLSCTKLPSRPRVYSVAYRELPRGRIVRLTPRQEALCLGHNTVAVYLQPSLSAVPSPYRLLSDGYKKLIKNVRMGHKIYL